MAFCDSVITGINTCGSALNLWKLVFLVSTKINFTSDGLNLYIMSTIIVLKKLLFPVPVVPATNKNITWKSSDESIATVSTTGEVTAKKYGTVNITATSANGKTSTIKINIKDYNNELNRKNIVLL